jgi:hypothetical protein
MTMNQLTGSEEDQEKFQRLIDELFVAYNPTTALDEADVITIARALWLKRNHLEFSSDTRRLDQEISSALTHLSKSKAIQRSQDSRRPPTGLMSNIRRKYPHWGFIRGPTSPRAWAQPRRSREILQLLAPPTGRYGFGKGLGPTDSKQANEFSRHRLDALVRKRNEGGLTPEEEIELEALDARVGLEDHPMYESILGWDRAAASDKAEDHPMYEAIKAWGKAAESGKADAAARDAARRNSLPPRGT